MQSFTHRRNIMKHCLVIVLLNLTADSYSTQFITYLSIKDIWYDQEFVLSQFNKELFSDFIIFSKL